MNAKPICIENQLDTDFIRRHKLICKNDRLITTPALDQPRENDRNFDLWPHEVADEAGLHSILRTGLEHFRRRHDDSCVPSSRLAPFLSVQD